MAGPSLDGRAAKSQEFEDPKNSMASASSQHKEPLETLTRRDPAEGLRPASPPKINPWARNMKPKETTLKAYAEDPPLPALIKEERKGYFSNTSTSESLRDTEGDSLGYGAEIIRPQGATSGSSLEDPRLPILIKEESKGDSSDTSSSESLRSRKCGSLSIGAETAKPGNDDQESTAEDQTPSSTTPPTSTASPTPYPTSTSTSLTLGTPSTSSEESRRALLAAVSRAEEKYEPFP